MEFSYKYIFIGLFFSVLHPNYSYSISFNFRLAFVVLNCSLKFKFVLNFLFRNSYLFLIFKIYSVPFVFILLFVIILKLFSNGTITNLVFVFVSVTVSASLQCAVLSRLILNNDVNDPKIVYFLS